jgi:hypothetical protein
VTVSYYVDLMGHRNVRILGEEDVAKLLERAPDLKLFAASYREKNGYPVDHIVVSRKAWEEHGWCEPIEPSPHL